jgi:hypothetical protein
VPWFLVDDRFHSHPKAAAASLAALGLWTVAGSWARDHLQDGEIPEHMITSLSRGATGLADELVSCGLWRRTKAGYRYHQWTADGDGSPRNTTRSEAIAQRQRKSSGGALGNHRRWHAARGVNVDDCAYCQPKRGSPTDRTTDRSTDRGSDRTPNPPVPVPVPGPNGGKGGGKSSPTPAVHSPPTPPVDNQPRQPPPRHCPRHPDGTTRNCGPCKDARLAWLAWEADRTARWQTAATCPEHPTQLADHCSTCRSERLARKDPP